ncbi:DNA polymerase III subunit delta' [Rhodophyticola sp. CCM32]|uniref:DNA polymerase III subunit delta' n=1 Tax=Rhodophyticola sp. CCM32 TaxID=2916397 RepID=UPI00107F4E31|nr:DNA polymerase III subunit delta' [Rhodophyticola sp. CCM32]QBX99332.1 DNA polymerase III subunit delta' [Rhodophyticola sp. CCM32]
MSVEDIPPEADRLDGAPHPRETAELFGQAEAEAGFLTAFTSDRLHHAWLLTGPRGVGKATLAWRMARFLLATPPETGEALFATPQPDNLDIPTDHPIARRLRALSEPGLMLLRRPWDQKTKRFKAQITVDEVRKLKDFFALSASDGGRRVVIVDAADEMNTNAANALLKVLEEPPAKAILLLVAHQPSRLLPTILSRCRRLRLTGLPEADLSRALARAGVETDSSGALAELAEGSVGEAVRLADLDGLTLYADLVALFASMPGMDRARASKLAEAAGARGAEARFDLTLALIDRLLSRLARAGTTGTAPPDIVAGEGEMLLRLAPDPAVARGWADLAQGLTARARRGRAVNLDPAALILDMCLSLEKTAARAPA